MNLDHKLDAPLDSLIHKREKKEPCRDFARGSCPRGSSCPFQHSGPPKEPCRDFLKGGECTRGASCPYSHKVPVDVCRDFLIR